MTKDQEIAHYRAFIDSLPRFSYLREMLADTVESVVADIRNDVIIDPLGELRRRKAEEEEQIKALQQKRRELQAAVEAAQRQLTQLQRDAQRAKEAIQEIRNEARRLSMA